MFSMVGGSAINEMKVFGIVLAVLVIIDLPMIMFINKKKYEDLFKGINGDASVSSLNKYLYGTLSYFVLALGIYFFCVKQKSYLNAVILGLVVFGVYDFTNLASIAKADVGTGFMDIGWGMTLCLLVTVIGSLLAGIFAKEGGDLGASLGDGVGEMPEMMTTTEA